MIRQLDVRYRKRVDMYPSGVQDKVDLSMGGMTWMGGRTFSVGIFHVGSGEEQPELPAAPERVEVTRDDHLFSGILDQAVELFKLVLTMPVLEGEVNNKYHHLIKLSFNYQPLDALRKIMKVAFDDGKPAQ